MFAKSWNWSRTLESERDHVLCRSLDDPGAALGAAKKIDLIAVAARLFQNVPLGDADEVGHRRMTG